jgi:hypothetical protein
MTRRRTFLLFCLLAGIGAAQGAAAADSPPVASTRGGSAEARDAAERSRIDADAALQRETERWHRSSAEAIRLHLRSVAAQGDARSLLAAALLWPSDADALEHGGPAVRPAQEQRAWFEAARKARPRDRLVAWVDLVSCGMSGDACDNEAAMAYLLAEDGDNAAIRLIAADLAQRRNDTEALERHWRAAAAASAYAPYSLELKQLLYAAMERAQQPAISSRLAAAQGAEVGLGRPMRAADWNTVWSLVHSAAALPSYTLPSRRCGAEALANASVEEEAHCERIMALMAEDRDVVIGPMIGLKNLARMYAGSGDGAHWRERLRALYWVYENAGRLLAGSPANAADPGEFALWSMSEGELAAMERLLAHNGLPLAPPPGWLPGREDLRALIQPPVAPLR